MKFPEATHKTYGPTLAVIALAVCFLLTGCMCDKKLRPYAGDWVLKSSDNNMMILRTTVRHGKLIGTLATPEHFHEGAEGTFDGISGPVLNKPVIGRLRHKSVELKVGTKLNRDEISMTLQDEGHARLHWANDMVPPWKFERATPRQDLRLYSGWPE